MLKLGRINFSGLYQWPVSVWQCVIRHQQLRELSIQLSIFLPKFQHPYDVTDNTKQSQKKSCIVLIEDAAAKYNNYTLGLEIVVILEALRRY